MRRKLAKLHNEASWLLAAYEEHKDSDDVRLRRRVHVDLDRFLMANRETATMLMVAGLQKELDNYKEPVKAPWYKRGLKSIVTSKN